ncbi:hypothetical protein P4B35_14920 [Pontiellaceae bacterium B12227]|nr:hypothetical protein [Pontiellaceae bacterium B12227]
MTYRITILIIPLLLSLLTACIAPQQTEPAERPATGFEALVFHPGATSAEPIPVAIFQTLEPSGSIREYYIDTDSVICGDGQCEIITVRLVWDPLGEFLRYEFPMGGNLTKRGHEQFTQEDHKKMLSILQDPASLLRDVAAKDVVHPGVAQTGDEIDGTSGATLLSDKSAIVSGAVYTCYTLWHWAQSDIQSEIRSITGETIINGQLLTYLNDPDEVKNSFAIQQLSERGIRDDATRDAVYQLALNGSTEVAAQAISYFQSLGAEDYYQAVGELFAQASSKKQVLYLSSLISTELKAPDGFYDELSSMLPNLGSYYEVHLLLNLMSAHNQDSEIVITHVLTLLNNPSFLIGRRAYNFLKELPLTDSQAAQVEGFRTTYADRL